MLYFVCKNTNETGIFSVDYRTLTENEIMPSMFAGFDRYQETTRCRKKVDGVWTIVDASFTDVWDEEAHTELCSILRETVRSGGLLLAAYNDLNLLKGFAAVESAKMGSLGQYRDLSRLYVSREMRQHGIGRELFFRAAQWAREQGAQKLYISAHSSVQAQAFYLSVGCVEALEYDPEHTKNEPGACQMEFVL